MERAAFKKPLTGRTVLICFLAFFGVVGGVNAAMVHFALSTFGGVETENAYRAGVAFNREIAAASQQEARHWQVQAQLTQVPEHGVQLAVQVRNASGAPVTGLEIASRLIHPTMARRDRNFALTETAAGTFRGETTVEAGQWDLLIDISRDGERLFRSTSRRILR
jgi:nitrogen fixation protein FixH